MPKKKITPSPVESLIHTIIHIISVIILYFIAIYFPLWLSITLLVLEVLQIKLFGQCFLTVIAHNRGVMMGKNFWEYMSYLFGARNPKKLGKKIDSIIKFTLVGILVFRLILFFISSRISW